MYNLTVSDGQTYFVADNDANTHAAAWVHNARLKLNTDRLQIKDRFKNKAEAWQKYKNNPDNARWGMQRWSKNYDARQQSQLSARASENGTGVSLTTPFGRRIIDDVPLNEVKTGYQALTKRIRLQIVKDAYLSRTQKTQAVWSFYGKASEPLKTKLKKFGIKIVEM